jgi:threonine synthase
MQPAGIIERYRSYLPVTPDTPVISLHEGSTPLLRADRLAAWACPGVQLYLKYEGMNPTGSFKDRGMTVAISMAAGEGAKAVICASTGNTSASAAAYAARAGMKCYVLAPEGKIALGKLAQAVAHGARVLAIKGNFDQALTLVREIAATEPIALVNSVNPHRLAGQKTVAFEIVDTLGFVPDYHAMPVGNAGNISAAWMGYTEWHGAGRIDRLPKMLGFQAEGAAPIVRGAPISDPETIATAIRIGNPASWKLATTARDESGGLIDLVTDAEILEAYHALSELEGVFVEPASAAGVAGIRKLAARGYFEAGVTVVATLTGHGLKDPDTALDTTISGVRSVSAIANDVLEALAG